MFTRIRRELAITRVVALGKRLDMISRSRAGIDGTLPELQHDAQFLDAESNRIQRRMGALRAFLKETA